MDQEAFIAGRKSGKAASAGVEIPVIIKDAIAKYKERTGPAMEASPPQAAAESQEEQAQEMQDKREEKKEDAPQEETKDEAIARLEEQIKRLSAEFENFRRRQERRFEDKLKVANEELVTEFLPVLDGIRKAHETADKEHSFERLLEGLDMVARQLEDTLKKLGLEEIVAEGETFDPAFHHAVQAEVTDEYPDQHIIREYQKGYRFKDRVIRPSMVLVARSP